MAIAGSSASLRAGSAKELFGRAEDASAAGGDAARVVRDWSLSPAGQKVVKETGYVPCFP